MNVEDLTLKQLREIRAAAQDAVAELTHAPIGAMTATEVRPKPLGPERAVIVCTDRRGVFFGYTADTSGERVTLVRARMVVYWSKAMRGLPGLADTGPDKDCRISPPMPAIELRGVTAIVGVTPAAAAAMEAAPWQK